MSVGAGILMESRDTDCGISEGVRELHVARSTRKQKEMR